jgi:hypothetical protein
MAGIKQPIKDILTKLATLQVVNQDNQTVGLFARLFNDQFSKLKKGEIEALPLPAGFLQLVSPTNFKRIGAGNDAGDITFRLHLGHEHMDAGDGTMEQDLAIFDIRDAAINLLSDYQPTGCSPLMFISEEPDNEHTNLYVYKIDFITHFIDTSASKQDFILQQVNDITVNGTSSDPVPRPVITETIIQPKTVYNIPQK